MTAHSIDLVMNVLDRAGHRCECGTTHGKLGARCPINNNGHRARRIVVAPADPDAVPATHDLTRPASQLRAWCTTCLISAQSRTRETAETQASSRGWADEAETKE
ncbi:MAG: hypothetical protein GEU93_19520 [Propionibacteriales bacterium]|nr:hypothetical protein [Propionibacteriales bacterium]